MDKLPRCTVCAHKMRDVIDQEILRKVTMRELSRRYGLSLSAVYRHSVQHVKRKIADALQAAEVVAATPKGQEPKPEDLLQVARGGDLLQKVVNLELDARRIGQAAEASGDRRTALAAVRELVGIIELLARLRHEIDTTTVNVLRIDAAEAAAMRESLVARLAVPTPETEQ